MFRLLRRLIDTPDATITLLAETVGLDRSTLGRNLRVLEKQGFVVLLSGTDGRVRKVDLTPSGKAALEMALPLWRTAQSDMKSVLGTDLDGLLNELDLVLNLPTPSTVSMR